MVLVGVIVLGSLALRSIPRFSTARPSGGCARDGRTVGSLGIWPAWLFYLPVDCVTSGSPLKHRSPTLPSAANPGILTGGLVGNRSSTPWSICFPPVRSLPRSPGCCRRGMPVHDGSIERIQGRERLTFPFILKPDVGQRGVGVKLIRNAADAEHCLERIAPRSWCNATSRVRWRPGCSITAFRTRLGVACLPSLKRYSTVTGDGVHTLEELIRQDSRARFMADATSRALCRTARGDLVPGQSLRLVEAGNHAQGCIFRDGARWWTPELEARIDEISQRIPGFSLAAMMCASSRSRNSGPAGIPDPELNGAAAEATSIYDERCSLRSAYATLFRQWELVFAIGAANRERGTVPTPPLWLWRPGGRPSDVWPPIRSRTSPAPPPPPQVESMCSVTFWPRRAGTAWP